MNIDPWKRNHRSSSSQIFFKKGVLKNFVNVTGKHLFWSLFLIKLQIWGLAYLLRRDSNTGAMRKKLQKHSFADILQKKVFLKISQISQQIPVLESLFNKIASPKTCNFIKKRLQHRCFAVTFGKFYEHLFYRTPPVGTFETKHLL